MVMMGNEHTKNMLAIAEGVSIYFWTTTYTPLNKTESTKKLRIKGLLGEYPNRLCKIDTKNGNTSGLMGTRSVSEL
jgi:hypothetical protein